MGNKDKVLAELLLAWVGDRKGTDIWSEPTSLPASLGEIRSRNRHCCLSVLQDDAVWSLDGAASLLYLSLNRTCERQVLVSVESVLVVCAVPF